MCFHKVVVALVLRMFCCLLRSTTVLQCKLACRKRSSLLRPFLLGVYFVSLPTSSISDLLDYQSHQEPFDSSSQGSPTLYSGSLRCKLMPSRSNMHQTDTLKHISQRIFKKTLGSHVTCSFEDKIH